MANISALNFSTRFR